MFYAIVFTIVYKMAGAPKEGQTFDSFAQFETFLQQYCRSAAQTFVIDDSKKIETVNSQLSDEKKLPACLKYGLSSLPASNLEKNKRRRIDL